MKEFYENQHILNLQAYYIPTYLDFSHADLEYADFSQSKKTHMPRTCCIGAKMQLVSYEFEYFYQCIMTFWGLRDSKGPILMHQAHLVQN